MHSDTNLLKEPVHKKTKHSQTELNFSTSNDTSLMSMTPSVPGSSHVARISPKQQRISMFIVWLCLSLSSPTLQAVSPQQCVSVEEKSCCTHYNSPVEKKITDFMYIFILWKSA